MYILCCLSAKSGYGSKTVRLGKDSIKVRAYVDHFTVDQSIQLWSTCAIIIAHHVHLYLLRALTAVV